MAIVKQSDNASNNAYIPILEMDEFLPIVQLKDPTKYEVEGEKFTLARNEDDSEEMAELPFYKNTSNQEIQILLLRTRQKELVFQFKVEKGKRSSQDDDGYLRAEVSKKKEDTETVEGVSVKIKEKSDAEYKETVLTSYKSEVSVKVDIDVDEHTEFYIRFIANDDENDLLGIRKGEYENVFCGCLKIYFEHTTKVGLRLTSNIEKLPLTPAGYSAPPTFSEPKKSFEVANKYQNSYGMCFAVSMARVRKAYKDEFGSDVLSLNLRGNDYLYSGTVIATIPNTYFGYGVGGALAAKNHATLISEEDIWKGALEEGAMLQYWNNLNSVSQSNLLKAIKDSLNSKQNENFSGGHSVVFKSYIRDVYGNITGFKFYDYSGIGRSYNRGGSKLFLGANLKDIN